jgi:hypothetical protein
MSQTLTPTDSQTAHTELAGVLTHLLRRYAADLPASQLNDVDRAVARGLDQIPDARRIAARMTRRVLDGRGRSGVQVLAPNLAAQPLDRAVDLDEIRSVFDLFPTQPVTAAVTSNRSYELRFSHLVCKDETNPEFFGSDEIYVVWGWTTEEMAKQGLPARTVRTPIYEDIDDGDRRPGSGSQNLRVFGPQPMGAGVVFTGTCFEHDLGDAAETMKDISVALTSAAGVAVLLGPIVAKVVAIGAAVTAFIASVGEDDQIGPTATLPMTQADADARTANSPSVMLPLLEHKQADGHYQSFLELRRV